MDFGSIAMLLFVCVASNHMGLVQAIEDVIGKPIPIVNCVKCFTFWSVFLLCITNRNGIIESVFVSFLSSYMAIWLELLMGYIDFIYYKVYEKIYPDNTNNPDSTAIEGVNPDNSLPELQEESEKT